MIEAPETLKILAERAVGAAKVVVKPLRLVGTSWRGAVAAGSQSQ